MSLIDDIKKDREAGTPGPWAHETHHKQGYDRIVPVWYVTSAKGAGVAVQPAFSNPDHEEANARRIARVPDMEAALIAAEELARLADLMESELGCDDEGCMCGSVRTALAAYRKATEGMK